MGSGRENSYEVRVEWTGNLGQGTTGYRAYSRGHEISAAGKPVIPGRRTQPFAETRPATTPKTSWSPRSRPATCYGICTWARDDAVLDGIRSSSDPVIRTRAADAVEKASRQRPELAAAPQDDVAP
ncbi:peroxiredoxin [Limnochorda pilosa]|uniref:Peroxiredoxin n=1 Tax=Limnochorda pilosa TaxID=1555112 RepID=A0A0K2SIB2_LIMPI|nr:peroxiredoxin [Limnochorda pilosa]